MKTKSRERTILERVLKDREEAIRRNLHGTRKVREISRKDIGSM